MIRALTAQLLTERVERRRQTGAIGARLEEQGDRTGTTGRGTEETATQEERPGRLRWGCAALHQGVRSQPAAVLTEQRMRAQVIQPLKAWRQQLHEHSAPGSTRTSSPQRDAERSAGARHVMMSTLVCSANDHGPPQLLSGQHVRESPRCSSLLSRQKPSRL